MRTILNIKTLVFASGVALSFLIGCSSDDSVTPSEVAGTFQNNPISTAGKTGAAAGSTAVAMGGSVATPAAGSGGTKTTAANAAGASGQNAGSGGASGAAGYAGSTAGSARPCFQP